MNASWRAPSGASAATSSVSARASHSTSRPPWMYARRLSSTLAARSVALIRGMIQARGSRRARLGDLVGDGVERHLLRAGQLLAGEQHAGDAVLAADHAQQRRAEPAAPA